jgi:hypothetical protein
MNLPVASVSHLDSEKVGDNGECGEEGSRAAEVGGVGVA